MSTKKNDQEKLKKKAQDSQAKEEKTFEQKKHEAYAAMGKLGGQARAKQLAEQGFSVHKNSLLKKPKK
jgi:hypothetical protein